MKNYDKSEDLERSDTEITLGMRSILGIFFGLVLVCGVFFGFGYSLGRGGNVSKASASPQAAPEITETASASPIKTVVEEPTPSSTNAAAASQSKPTAAAPVPPQTVQATNTSVYPNSSAPAQATQASYNPSAPAKAASATYSIPPSANPSAASPSAAVMVQIAAVSRPQDADVLVSALRKLGYSASVRSETNDPLLHVQIGPFATRDAAKVMRAKLLSDGYNAILK